MTETVLHPGLVLIAGALALPALRGALRAAFVVALPLAVLWLVWQVGDGALWQLHFLDFELTPLHGDKLARLFGTIFALMAAGGGLYALGQESRVELPAAFVYAGAAIGAVFAGDLVTLFVFWELMAVGSTLVVWSGGTRASYRASMRYLMIHLLGGVILLAGITGHITQTGSIAFASMKLDAPSNWLILIGFLINAAATPISAWLPDAYPEASWSGMVFLSAFTTKTAVYALMRGFPGTELLVWLGLAMVFYGIVYALLESDMRRILAYSIVNQSGFMVAGIGIGTETALNGAAANAFTGVIYVALLVMAAGSVLRMTGKRDCSDLGGLFRSMPLTTTCAAIGALSISAFPFSAGFVSKSMISQAAADGHMLAVWLLLGAGSAGVVLHAGLKFPWLVFFDRDAGLRPAEAPASMRWAMIFFAFLCIALGIWFEPLYAMLPYAVDHAPYTAAHVLTQTQLLLFSALAFLVALPRLKRARTITLDVDWIYRRALPRATAVCAALIDRAMGAASQAVQTFLSRAAALIYRFHGPQARLARTWTTRGMALWVLVLLIGYLVLYFV
ncbi:MAG TPA: Na(+)/H(+) antiporter subunit D [Burkholderiaceae bacterium]|nr:Na(+)/H(+) antiporter subunit D [Burkholderiaceae bacterium]